MEDTRRWKGGRWVGESWEDRTMTEGRGKEAGRWEGRRQRERKKQKAVHLLKHRINSGFSLKVS